jgi:uncharacterized protein
VPVAVVMGARQTAKSTLATALQDEPRRRFETLDDIDVLEQAREAPADLVRRAPTMTIDEVQRVPELLLAIKKAVDEERPRRAGRFKLTGSANLPLMHKVSESTCRSRCICFPLAEEVGHRLEMHPPVDPGAGSIE